MALIVTIRQGDTVHIGDNVRLYWYYRPGKQRSNFVRIVIEAPREVPIRWTKKASILKKAISSLGPDMLEETYILQRGDDE